MARFRKRGEAIRAFIIRNAEDQASGLVSKVMREFAISRQAVHKHLRYLVDGKILLQGAPPGRYQLCTLGDSKKILSVAGNPEEDVVWRTEVREMVGDLPENALDLWRCGFTEMFNNVVEHSGAESAFIQVKNTAFSTKMTIWDRGVGIFRKIGSHFTFIDERHAAIELVKGGLTTDRTAHSGEGLFFTTRMFDTFSILSGGILLAHTTSDDGDDWTLATQEDRSGTLITMTLKNATSRLIRDIYQKCSSDGISGLSTTVVPAHLAQYGTEKLVSRSEAKRLLTGLARFKTALIDFGGIDSIGEAFADEVFRIFPAAHPGIEIREIRANKEIRSMIDGVRKRTEAQGALPAHLS
ncbi:MAG TPA: ArsR family transcriptional regulator [Deltaproteobacteria bacterium]|nr:ArsR family transcriptional regulator [Deltaproteobacteria bacterium]